MTTKLHTIQNLIDEHQTDLSDNLYKKLCDELGKIHIVTEKEKTKFAKITAYYHYKYIDEDKDTCEHIRKMFIHVKIVDEPAGQFAGTGCCWLFKTGNLSREVYDSWTGHINITGYVRRSMCDHCHVLITDITPAE